MTQKEKQYAWITVAVVGALLLYEFVIDPFFKDYDDTKSQLEKVQGNVTRAQTLFGTERQKQRVWDAMLAQGLKSQLEDSKSQALSAVIHWAGGAGVNISETHGEPMPRTEGKFLISTYKFTGLGSMRSISRWLMAIEKGAVPPSAAGQPAGRIPLRIDDLVITPRKPGTDDLQAVVTVSTLCLIPDAPPANNGTGTGNNPAPHNDGNNNNGKTDNAHTGPVAQSGSWGDRS